MKEEIIDKRLRGIRPLVEIRNLGEYDIEVASLKAELQAQKTSHEEDIEIAYKRGYLDGAIKAQKLLKTN